MDKIYTCSYTLETLVSEVRRFMDTEDMLKEKLTKAARHLFDKKQQLVEEKLKNQTLESQIEILSQDLQSKSEEVQQLEGKIHFL